MLIRRLIAFSSLTLTESRWGTSTFITHQRSVHLPSQHKLYAESNTGQSVTGPVYDMSGGPSVKLFTKEGCTLCDKVKDVCVYLTWCMLSIAMCYLTSCAPPGIGIGSRRASPFSLRC